MRTVFMYSILGILAHSLCHAQTIAPVELYNHTNRLLWEQQQRYFDYLILFAHQPESEALAQQAQICERSQSALKDWAETIEKSPGTAIFATQLTRYVEHEYLMDSQREITSQTEVSSLAGWEALWSEHEKFNVMQVQSKNLLKQLSDAMGRYAKANELVSDDSQSQESVGDSIMKNVNQALAVRNFTLIFTNPLIGLRNSFAESLNDRKCTEAANALTTIKSLLPIMRKEVGAVLPQNPTEANILAQLKRTLAMMEAFTHAQKGAMTQVVGICWRFDQGTHTNDDTLLYNDSLDKMENILGVEFDKLQDLTQSYMRQSTPTARE